MQTTRTLIVGNGQIGSSLAEVLRPTYDVSAIDVNQEAVGPFGIMHVCFPPSEKFVEHVLEYYRKYNPQYVVIHSTVPVGTTQELGKTVHRIVHSPVEGRHPNLVESIKTFGKFIGADDINYGAEVCVYFQRAGIRAKQVFGSKNTELGKIVSTTRLGWDVVAMKDIMQMCQKFGTDFDVVYTQYTENYNQGYADMDKAAFSKFHRPVLAPMRGPIGGHCVMANCELVDSLMTQTIKQQNKFYAENPLL